MEEEKIYLEKIKKYTDEEIETISQVYQKYYQWKSIHSSSFDELGGKNIREYVSEARKKFYGKVALTTEYELSGRKVFFTQEYRNAVKKILTWVLNLSLNPQFQGVEGFDVEISTLLNSLYKKITGATEYKIKKLFQFLQCAIDGTVIVYIDGRYKEKKYKDIKYFDPVNYEIDFEEKTDYEFDAEERIVNIDDFFFPKIYENELQKQGEVIERVYMRFPEFKKKFGKYPNAQYVHPGSRLSDQSLIGQLLDKTLFVSEKIEVLKYYNSSKDEFVVIANGVWINPVKSGKKYEKSPLPWNHKKLPFAHSIFDPISNNFFYGASIIHQIKSPVEALENLIEMSLDRIWKAINPPIITADPSIPEKETKIESGDVIYSPVPDMWRELQMNTLDPNVWNMNVFLQGHIDKITTPLIPPTTPTRQPKSASEMLIRQQLTQQSFSLPKIFYQYLLEQSAYLQIKNMLQFMTSTDIQKTLGERRFNSILRVNNVPTPSGVSNVEIRVVPNEKSLLSPEELRREKLLRALRNKKNIEIIEVSSEMLKDIDFDITIKFDLEQTPQVMKGLFMEFTQLITQMFPDIIDRRKALVRLFEIWNENPGDWLIEGAYENILGSKTGLVEPTAEETNPLTEMVKRAGGQSAEEGVQGGRPGYGSPKRDEFFPDLKDLLSTEM